MNSRNTVLATCIAVILHEPQKVHLFGSMVIAKTASRNIAFKATDE